MATKKKAPTRTVKAPKTEALSIRIDPRLRYGLELLARKQRRSVTGVVEWAIDQVLGNEAADWLINGEPISFMDAVKQVWSPNEIERLVLLGSHFPDLMTYEETRLHHVLIHSPDLWEGGDPGQGKLDEHVCLGQWDKLAPLLHDAAARPVLQGLTAAELDAAGIEALPF